MLLPPGRWLELELPGTHYEGVGLNTREGVKSNTSYLDGKIFQDTAALPDAPLSGIIKKKDLETKKERNNVSNKKLYYRKGIPGGAKGKTATIELMTPYKVNGYGNNKGKKYCIYYQYGRSGVNSEDQSNTGKKLQERQNYGDQVYGKVRKKIVPVNYFCKMCRFDNLVIARKEEHSSQNPACNQLKPGILK